MWVFSHGFAVFVGVVGRVVLAMCFGGGHLLAMPRCVFGGRVLLQLGVVFTCPRGTGSSEPSNLGAFSSN